VKVSAYQSVAAHGSVAAADPHRLVLLLLEGAMSRITLARACHARGERQERNRHLERGVEMVGELRASLDLSQGPLARNFDDLYDFVIRQLLLGQLTPDMGGLAGAASVLNEIRSAWAALAPEVGAVRAAG
jgi:flagellar protein FliS